MKNKTTTYKWAYLPFVFSSAAILATQATAGPTGSQRYQDAKQVNSINHEYVGGDHNIGFGVDDEGNFDVELNGTLSRSENHRTGGGLWAGYDVDTKDVTGRGGQINHAWVSRDSAGQATHVNKAFAAYDRDAAGHDRATVGYGQETENMFWDGRVSKGLSGGLNKRNDNGVIVTDRAYDWGVGAQIGTHLKGANARVRAGIDHEWSDKVGSNEKDARNTTLSAGIEKFFQGTGHSVSLDVAGSKSEGGHGNNDDTDFNGRLGYKYDFGGASIYQPDRRYRRVRVEVPGKAIPPRYEKQQQYKKVPTYKTVPVYGNKTVRTPTKQLVKSTMELEGQTFFKLNSAKLIPSAQTRLKQIAAQIRKTGYKGSIRITGNTCGLGNARYDQILSERRANEVRNFLIKNGFNPNHLVARGLGKDHPKFPRTPDQDFKNRRVDIEYVSQQQVQKTGYKTENKRVQTGTRQVATGFKNVPAGMKNVMVSNGQPGAPRVVWRTEAIASTPAWIGRALNNNIQHNTSINTFTTTYGNEIPAPSLSNDTATTAEGSAVTIPVLANDTSNSGSGELTITDVSNPSNGSAVISGGQIVYTPNAGFVGTDTFTYTVTDSNGQTATATTTVTVVGDELPEPQNDVATTTAGTAVQLPVLANDTSNSGSGQLAVTSVSNPQNGSAVIINGQIVYTPNSGFVGTDTFTYTVTDSNGQTASATATVTVTADVPEAQNDSATTSEGTAVTLPVLGNDISNSGSGQLVISSVGTPSNGTATIVNGQIVYTPIAGFVGDDSFTYTVTDSNGQIATATATVTVEGDAPVAQNDSATTPEGMAVTLPVLGNDTSNSGSGQLTISSVTNPQNGTATIVNGQIVYTPDAGFSGTDSFVYTITDSNGETATATATVIVEDNDEPVAQNDSATTPEGMAVTLSVLSNDTSNSGSGQLTISSVTNPQNGTATIVNGQIVYTPDAGFSGTDSFVYTITDSNGETATATGTVIVTDDDFAPEAENDSATTSEGMAVTLPVLDNDSTNSGSDQLTISNVSNPQNGTAQIVAGEIVYTPDAGFTGTDSFIYTITDSNGETATATGIVTVVDGNSKPDANNDSSTTPFETPVSIDVLGNDTDPENDTLSVTSFTQGDDGTVTEGVNGELVYTPNDGFEGSDTFTYTITDGNGGSDTTTVVVTVGEGNSKPDANNDSSTTPFETPVSIDVLGNDTDPENDTLSVTSFTQGDDGTVTEGANGELVYTPNDGFEGSDTFTYTITDGNGGSDTTTVVVTVGEGNSKPDANNDSSTTPFETPVSINVLGNDTDPENDTLSVTGFTQGSNGTVSQGANGELVYTPNDGFEGRDSFTYTITDGNGGSDTTTVAVTVGEGNSKPDANNDSSTTPFETPVSINVLGNDTDPENDTLSVTGFTQGSNGTVSQGANGELVYTPNDGFEGGDSFTYTITDGNGGSDTTTVAVRVGEEEDEKPEAQNDSASTSEGMSVTLPVLGNDTTNSGSGQLTITNVGNPQNGTALVVNGKVVYTPDSGFVGVDSFVYTITDSNGKTDTATATVTVAEGDKPEAQDDSATTPSGTAVLLPVLGNDTTNSGSGELTVSSVGTPANGTAAIVNNQIVYTPNMGFSGADSFTYTITDSNGKTDMATATVTVENGGPVAKDDSATTSCSAITIDVLANDFDIDGDALSIFSVDAGSLMHGAVMQSGNQIIYTPSSDCNKGNIGVDNFSYTITDGNGNTDSAHVSVTVQGIPTGAVNADAVSDDALIQEGETVTLNVLANDSGNGLRIVAVDNPTNGTASFTNNTVTYTPDAGFTGSEMFYYDIVDENGYDDAAMIIIDVVAGCVTGTKCN